MHPQPDLAISLRLAQLGRNQQGDGPERSAGDRTWLRGRRASSRFLLGLFGAVFLAAFCGPKAGAQLTINANFTTADTTGFFPKSTPIASSGLGSSNITTIENSIVQAIAQVTALINTQMTLTINFLDDSSVGLGSSVGTGLIDFAYSQYRTDLQADSHKSSADTTAIASLPAGTVTGTHSNASQMLLAGPILKALGDNTDGDSLISQNGGLAGTVALNLSLMNYSRTNYNTAKYDIISTVTHEVSEILGSGGQGSTIGEASTPEVGPMDLFRFTAKNTRSYSTSASVSSYFSIDGGTTDLVHFNQKSGGDYADWGDGVTPADDNGNTPPQVQDAFGDTTAEPNMGRNEAIALDVIGWDLTSAGLALETVPEPEGGGLAVLGAGILAAGRLGRRLRRCSDGMLATGNGG